MEKLKKLAKVWGVIALLMIIVACCIKELTDGFWYTFLAFYLVSGIFVALGWDKYITYGDNVPATKGDNHLYEDPDDWLG